ncbi:MAG: PKD domain-containing protein, partial [Bacteroidia bacterium]
GKGKVTITQTNALGCDTTVDMPVNIHGRPLIGIIGDSGVCEKSTKDYHATDTSQTLNEWLIDNGLPISQLDGNAIKVNWAKSGVGNIILKQTSKEGCDTTAIKNIDVNNKPVPYMNGKDTACANTIENYEIGATPGHKYKWIVLNGTILGSATNPLVTIKWGAASTGYVFLTETNTKGCDSTVMAKVTVASYPKPHLTGPAKACEEMGGYIYSTPSNSKSTFTWLVSGGVVENQNYNIINVKWNTEGNGYILVKETNAYGCSATDTLFVEIIKLKTIATAKVIYPCDPSPVEFHLDANDKLLNVLWTFGDGTSSSERNPTHIYSSPGTYVVNVISTSLTGCSDSTGTTVTIYNGPDADFDIFYNNPEQIFYCLDDSVEFTNTSTGGLRYEWNFGDTTGSNYFNTGHVYKRPGNYEVKLKAYNELGCVDSMIKTIYVDARVSLYEPNAFTPGSSKNINDYFSIAMYNIESLHVDIYNRWGERVFESDEIDFKWDGTYKGEPVQQDVYIYIIKAINIKGDPETRNGTIMLLR